MQQGNKHKIHYHNPLQRLILHSKLQQQLQLHEEIAEQFHGIDIISIIDALIKRGLVGSNKQSNHPNDRMDEVYLSLPYYGRDTVEFTAKIINNWRLGGFKKFVQQAKKMIKLFEQPIVQAHLLPSSKHPYYHMQTEEQQLIESNFNNVDEYLCLKTISIFSQGTKVPEEYKQKYELVQIWQYLHNRIQQLTSYPQLKLQLPQLSQNNRKTSQSISTPILNNKLCILGISVSTLLLAIRISRMGISVTLVPLQPVTDFVGQIGYIQGVFIENQMEVNRVNKILRQQLGMEIYALQIADHLQKQQKHLTILLDQVLQQWPCNSNKNLWQQICHQHNSNSLKSMKQNNQRKSNSVNSSMTGQKIDLQQLRLYYNRMLMMNRVGNQNTFSVAHFMALLNGKNTSLAVLFCINRVYGLREFGNGREVLENNVKKCNNLKIQWNSRVTKVRQVKNNQMWQIHVQQQNEQSCKALSFQRILISQLPPSAQLTQQSIFPISLTKSTINLTPIVNIICVYHFNQNQTFLSHEVKKSNLINKEGKNQANQCWTCANRFGIITYHCVGNQTVVAMLDIKDIKQYNKQQLYSQIGQLLQQWLKSKPPIKQPKPKIYYSTYYICPAAHNPISPSQISKNNAYISIPVKNILDQNTSLLFNHLEQNSSLFGALFLKTSIDRSKDKVTEKKINYMIGECEELEDFFGVKRPFVSQWKELMINSTKKISQMVLRVYKKLDSNQSKTHNIPWHIVQTPVPIQSGKHCFFVQDLGLPKQNKIHMQQPDLIGYKCTRYGPSLVHDGQGIFKHAIIWNSSRQQAVYFLVQFVSYAHQQYLLVLFHNDLNTLNSAIRSLQSNSQIATASIKCDNRYIDQNVLLDHCQNLLNQHSYTETLQKKLTALTHLKTHPLTTPPSSTDAILFLHPNLVNPTNLVPNPSNTIQKVIKTINQYCSFYCQWYGLKQYTFTDLFLGKINLTYLLYQIQHNVRSHGYSIDFSLADNLRQQAGWQKYCLSVREGQGNRDIAVVRRFLGFRQQYRYQFVDYVYVLDQSQIICGYPYRNVKAQLWIRQFLLQLIQNGNAGSGGKIQLIINELKHLVHDQMKTISSILSPKTNQLQKYIQVYFLMTRMQRPDSQSKNPIYKQNTIQKIMSFSQGYVDQDTFCTPEQILELGTMVDEDHIQIYDSDQFIITITP